MAKANYLLPTVKDNIPNFTFINDLTKGWNGVVGKGSEYLPKQLKETDEVYNLRLKLATYLDSFNPTVEGILGLIFQKPISIETNQPEAQEFIDNADLRGKDINNFIKSYFNVALRKGLAYAYVDIPYSPKGQPKFDKQRKALGIRPFVVMIEPENIINWKTAVIGGKIVLIQLTIREFVQKDKAGSDFEVETVEQFRVIKIGSFVVYDKDDAIIDKGDTGLTSIPLVELNLDENGSFFSAKPPFLDLGKLSISNYQLMSDSRWAANTASIPFLMLAGFTPEEAKKMVVSVNKAMVSSNVDSKASYVDYEGKGVALNLLLMEKIDKRIAEIGMSVLSESNIEVTATEKTLDAIQTQSKLQNWVDSLVMSLYQILELVMNYYNKSFEGQISISANILDRGLSAEEIKTYSSMVAQSQLSLLTFWDIMKTKGRLSEDFDPVKEQSNIDAETPTLDTMTI